MSEQNDFLTDFSTNFFTNFSQEFSGADMSAYTPPTLTPEEEEAIINKEWSKVPPVSELFKEETEPEKKEVDTLKEEYKEFLENLNTSQKRKDIEEQKRIIAEHKKKYKKYLDETNVICKQKYKRNITRSVDAFLWTRLSPCFDFIVKRNTSKHPRKTV